MLKYKKVSLRTVQCVRISIAGGIMGALIINGAKLYDEQFAKVFPSDWEMAVLSKHLDSAKTLLDVGCGTGRHVVALARKGLRILAIDSDKECVEAAEAKIRSKQLTDAVDLMIADARHIPLRALPFDAVICMGNVLGDVGIKRQDRIAIVEETIRAAGPETIFIIELVHRYWRPSDLVVWLFRYLTTSLGKLTGESLEYGDYTETIRSSGHADKLTFHAFTTAEARQLLANRGFNVTVEKRGKFFHDWFIIVARRNEA
jgi:2-polyprenyl-3-methyl-5-hydroxy-6-metoxy-1,4-benzoquinol methylase